MRTIDDLSSLTRTYDFVYWIDFNHFICLTDEENVRRLRMAEIDGGKIKIYDIGFDKDVEHSIFIKPK
jgi:hypothetical protein